MNNELEWMIMNNELKWMCKEAVLTFCKFLSQQYAGGTEQTHDKTQLK
jgi:hypothetical protein